MAAFNAVWSVDIGKFSLKAVHLRRYGSQVVIVGTDRVEYDIGPQGVDSIGGVKEALQIFRSRNSVRSPVIVCLPGQEALPRFIKIVADDERKLHELVRYEAKQQIPFDIQDVVWDWALVPRDYVPGQEKEIGIFAARRETVDDLLLELKSNGIQGQQVVLGYLGLLNYVQYEMRPKSPSVVLDIGADHTALILMDNGAFWIRALPFSGNQITRELSNRFNLNFAEAERLKRQAAKSQQKQKIFSALRQPLGNFVNEVQRSVGFYRSQVSETAFKNLYLFGQGSLTLGLGRFLQDRLRLRVQRPASLSRIRPGEGVDVAEVRTQLPSLAPAIGAGLQGLGTSTTHVDLIPPEQQVYLTFTRRRKLVFAAGAVLLFVLFLFGKSYDNSRIEASDIKNKSDTRLMDLNSSKNELPGEPEMAKLKEQIKAISKAGEERDYFARSFAEIHNVLKNISGDAFQNASDVYSSLSTAQVDQRALFVMPLVESEKKDQIKSFVDTLYEEFAWLLSLRARYVGESEEDRRRTRPRTGEETGGPTGYEFTLTGAITRRQTSEQSQRVASSKVLQPLKEALQSNPFTRKHLLREPKMLVVDQPDLYKLADPEKETLFRDGWYLARPKKLRNLRLKEAGDSEATDATAYQEPKYYLFRIQWLLGEKEPEPEPAEGSLSSRRK